MKYDLLALDLDGTALRSDRSTFSPRLTAALNALHHQGTAVVIATGRQYALLPPAVEEGGAWRDLGILANGAEIRRLNTGELLCGHYMQGSLIAKLTRLAAGLGLPVEASRNGTLYLTQQSWDAQKPHQQQLFFHLTHVLPNQGMVVDSLEEFACDLGPVFEKVNLPYIPSEARAAVEQALTSLPVRFAWAGPNSLELTHWEATKGAALTWVCRTMGIPLENAAAIGDSGNDISMLTSAGLGIAMGNAPANVRQAADAVTEEKEQDGAAKAIERWLLK